MTVKSALRELNSALLDLQAADYDTCARPLKRMAAVLASEDLRRITDELKAGVDFDKFLASSQKAGGMGNDHLDWPVDREKELGLTIELIERAAKDIRWFFDFAHRYYSSTSSKIIATIQKVTTSVFIPFNRDFAAYVDARERLEGVDSPRSAMRPMIAATSGSASGAGTGQAIGESVADASRWTGVTSRTARLTSVRGQIEAAHDAIRYLIDDLATDEGNGGPLLEEHSEALDLLRHLHRVVGELLAAIDGGRLDDELGESFAAQIGRFDGRWLASLRDDPARYFVGLTTFATLTACGLGDWGGFISGAALAVSKKNRSGRVNSNERF